MEEKGIYVISSSIEGAGLDVPAVSAAITTPVKDKSCDYVIDLGGNDVEQKCWEELFLYYSRRK